MRTKSQNSDVIQEMNLDRILETYIPSVIEAMKRTIAPQCEFTPMDWREAERLLQTCVLAICDDAFHPAQAKEIVRDLRSGYSCWLQWIEKGLRLVLDRVPDPDHIRPQLWGAFRMIKPFLYDVDVTTHHILRGKKSKRDREEEYLERQLANS